MENMLDDIQPIEYKPRNPLIAFALSLLLPGLGQVYNGQLKKGLLFFVIMLIYPFVFGITRWVTFFYGMLFLIAVEIGFRIYVLIDANKQAKKQKYYIPKTYNTWYVYLLVSLGMIAISFVNDSNKVLGVQSFHIPSVSNNPTLQVGDFIIADLWAYQQKEPNYGDIIVYSRPDEQVYTFRIVGLPNDRLDLIDNIVSINGEPGKATFLYDTTIDNVPHLAFEEELPNGHKHQIFKLKYPYDSTYTRISNIIIPPNSYYVLGDNRDNAADSRYEEGFISRDKILGRLLYSYWGQNMNRINIDFRDK